MPPHPYPLRAVRRSPRGPLVVRRSAGPDALLTQLADRPDAVLAGFLGTTLVAAEPDAAVTGPDAWSVLGMPADGGRAALGGAWIGYLGYGPPPAEASGADAAPARLARYPAVAQFLDDGTCLVWGSGRRARDLARRAARYAAVPAVRPPARRAEDPVSSLPAAAYRAGVAEIVSRIAAGDFSQVNLVQRLDAAWTGSPLAFAVRLWAAAGPAPLRAYAHGPEGVLVSASPERLLAIEDGIAWSAPIKGTAPVGSGAELAASAKDRAEHVMIVDLVRNDLGRVSVAGGVAVPRLVVPLRTGYAEHLVSEVCGRLRAGVTVGGALAALFPAGSITGAPKHAAMAAIAALEPVGRGPAFGSMLAVAPDGRCEASVLIRTAWLAGGQAAYWCGGGVTWDSDPAAEHAEAIVKARPFLEALGCG